MMISCQEVITELWDYLDGELPPERATAIADHLAECARCYPQYRFEYGFLAAVARQRVQGPGPSPALIDKVAGAVLAGTPSGAGRHVDLQRRAATEHHRAIPRAAAPLAPRGPAIARAPSERWALAVLRVTLGAFMFLGLGRLLITGGTAQVAPGYLGVVASVEGILAALVVLGAWRRWSYGAALLVHMASLLMLWGQLRDPWGAALAGLPACGALVTLYLLRERDTWTLDAWLALRRPSRAVG
jgi:anti-sigma factor (TIGR02949 family)